MELSYRNHNSTYITVLVALQPSFALGSLDVLSRGDNRIEFALAVLCKWSLIQKVSELSESLIYPCLTRVYRPKFIIFPWKSLQSQWKVYRKLTKQNLSTLANRRTGCFFNWYKAKQANLEPWFKIIGCISNWRIWLSTTLLFLSIISFWYLLIIY